MRARRWWCRPRPSSSCERAISGLAPHRRASSTRPCSAPLLRAGYDRSFEELGPRDRSPARVTCTHRRRRDRDHRQHRAPARRYRASTPAGSARASRPTSSSTSFGPRARAGVCVNLGGDVRVDGREPAPATRGRSPSTTPQCADPIARIGLDRRRGQRPRRRCGAAWHVGGEIASPPDRSRDRSALDERPHVRDRRRRLRVDGRSARQEPCCSRGTAEPRSTVLDGDRRRTALADRSTTATSPRRRVSTATSPSPPDLRLADPLGRTLALAVIGIMSGNSALVHRTRGRARRVGRSSRPRPCGASRSRPRSSARGRARTGSSTCTAGSVVTALVFTGVHVSALLLDQYTHFGAQRRSSFPFAATWHPVAVAWGVVAGSTCCSRWSSPRWRAPGSPSGCGGGSTSRASCCS